MAQPTIKKRIAKAISFLPFFAFIFTLSSMNSVYAQNQASVASSEQVNSVDRDLVDQFEAAVNAEIQEVQSNPNYSAEEKLVRGKFL